MSSEDDLHSLIGQIYESAADPRGWDVFLSDLTRLFRGQFAAITYHGNRRAEHGPFGERQLRLLRILESALDLMATPVVFVGATGSIIGVNRAADALLKQRDALLSTREGLRARNAHDSMELERLIGEVARTSGGSSLHAGGVVEVSRKAPKLPLFEPRPSQCHRG